MNEENDTRAPKEETTPPSYEAGLCDADCSLRPVLITAGGPLHLAEARFHGWDYTPYCPIGDGSMVMPKMLAVLELENGTIHYLEPMKFQFEDRSESWEKHGLTSKEMATEAF